MRRCQRSKGAEVGNPRGNRRTSCNDCGAHVIERGAAQDGSGLLPLGVHRAADHARRQRSREIGYALAPRPVEALSRAVGPAEDRWTRADRTRTLEVSESWRKGRAIGALRNELAQP